MKIAVIMDDERTISQHVGRAPYYLVATIDDGQVIAWQRRDKLGHAHFADELREHQPLPARSCSGLSLRHPSRK